MIVRWKLKFEFKSLLIIEIFLIFLNIVNANYENYIKNIISLQRSKRQTGSKKKLLNI